MKLYWFSYPFLPSHSLVLGLFVLLCLLAQFFKSEFLSNFSLSRNLDVIYKVQPDPNNNLDEMSSILHGLKFQMIIGSVVLHAMGLPMLLFFSQMFAPAKEVLFSPWFHLPGTRFYFIADVSFCFLSKNDPFNDSFKLNASTNQTQLISGPVLFRWLLCLLGLVSF